MEDPIHAARVISRAEARLGRTLDLDQLDAGALKDLLIDEDYKEPEPVSLTSFLPTFRVNPGPFLPSIRWKMPVTSFFP